LNTLHLHRPDGTDERIALPLQGAFVIGRDPDSGLVLEDPHQVSWRHARIDCTLDACVIEDLDSTNGTFIDDVQVSRQGLVDGMVLGIGPYRLVFQRGQEAPSASSSSEKTLFSSGADHPHQIEHVQDPYATRLTAEHKGTTRQGPRRSTRGADCPGS
jgi:pSer/pThr/pTyr-binding forkhead associated (FHA) protein